MRKLVLAALVAVALTCVGLASSTSPVPSREDCAYYTPSTITIVDKGEQGWTLERTDGAMFAQLDTKADADAALAVAKQHTAICYIGRDNKRPRHMDYVMVYWK